MHLLILLLWCFGGIVKSRTEKALTLNINTTQLDDTAYYGDFSKCPVLTACPSSESYEIQFNREISISKKSLFLRNVHRSDKYAKDIPVDICEKPVKPAVIYNVISQEIQIGYELYYQENKISLKGKNYDWYKSTNFNKENTENETTNSTQQSKLFVTKYQDRYKNHTRFTFASGSSTVDLIFHWIPVLSIKSVSDHQKCISFLDVEIVNVNKAALTDKCSNYNTTDAVVDLLYSEENQAKIWKDISTAASLSKNTTINSDNITINSTNNTTTIPSTSKTTSNYKDNFINHPCGSPYGCLAKTQIIPLWYFRTNSAKLASCLYPNTAPIWRAIAEKQVAKVDRYIYALTRYVIRDLKGEARLYFGVSGILKLKKSANSNKSEEICLSDPVHNLTIAVPKIIYRIVHCAVCIWQKTLIVIHNDFTPIPDSERLCSESSEVDGWDEIRNTDYKTGFTYACRLTKEIDDMLGSQFLRNDVYRGFDGVDLKDFPYAWVEDENNDHMEVMVLPGLRPVYGDIRPRVGREFDSLSPIRRNY